MAADRWPVYPGGWPHSHCWSLAACRLLGSGRLLAIGRWPLYRACFPLQDGRWHLADARCSAVGYGPHRIRYFGYLFFVPEVKRPGHGADHPPQFSVMVKNGYSCTSVSLCVPTVACYGATFTANFPLSRKQISIY
jgi:hypothetical protein